MLAPIFNPAHKGTLFLITEICRFSKGTLTLLSMNFVPAHKKHESCLYTTLFLLIRSFIQFSNELYPHVQENYSCSSGALCLLTRHFLCSQGTLSLFKITLSLLISNFIPVHKELYSRLPIEFFFPSCLSLVYVHLG